LCNYLVSAWRIQTSVEGIFASAAIAYIKTCLHLWAGFLYLVKGKTFYTEKNRHHFSIFMKVKDTITRIEK